MNNNEFPKGISYKVNENGKYYISAKEWNGKTFYNTKITQKNADGTSVEFQRQLRFIKCEPPKNGDCIKIISGFESNYANTKDQYNCITVICVTEYEIVNEVKVEDAFAEYNEQISGNDIQVDESQLPF